MHAGNYSGHHSHHNQHGHHGGSHSHYHSSQHHHQHGGSSTIVVGDSITKTLVDNDFIRPSGTRYADEPMLCPFVWKTQKGQDDEAD